MNGHLPESAGEGERPELPEDVAAVYSWAKLPGMPYREFSGSQGEEGAGPLVAAPAHPESEDNPRPLPTEGSDAAPETAPDDDMLPRRFPQMLPVRRSVPRPSSAPGADLPTDTSAGEAPYTGSSTARQIPPSVRARQFSAQAVRPPLTSPGKPDRTETEAVLGLFAPQFGSPAPAKIDRSADVAAAAEQATPVEPPPVERVEPVTQQVAEPQTAEAVAPPPATQAVSAASPKTAGRRPPRWSALREAAQFPSSQTAAAERQVRAPLLTVLSWTGGVGKTSIVAALGRALSAHGEQVLLADMTAAGILPFYFGAREMRRGLLRTFSAPEGIVCKPVRTVSYDAPQAAADPAESDRLLDGVVRASYGLGRILADFSTNDTALASRLAGMSTALLLPLTPDMNSVLSLRSVESFLARIGDESERTIEPVYVLNQFDEGQPLHVDVREVLNARLGERLLPFVIRRSPLVAEALAEGMTVLDYAPEADVCADYVRLADWLRAQSFAHSEAGNARWTER